MQSANRDMEALVESFLILAREGDTGLPDEHFPASDVVADEVEKVRPMLAGKPVDLRVEKHVDFELHAPSTVLAVMLGNLLRNACRYTDAGHVTVRLTAARIDVIDTGIGMSPEELSRAFEPFYRGAGGQTGGREVGQGIGAHRVGARPRHARGDPLPARGGDALRPLASTRARGTRWIHRHAAILRDSSRRTLA